ncbi:hypothetical protein KKB55_02875, partial [Myxococcota bacterium]|nr:hypothetical protein [Myxococcota bacterium]
VELTVTEVPLAECLNRRDDDEDGRVDYPTDPGCESPRDRDERTPSPTPACANDEDDDGDGRVDYPLDPGCLSAASTSELDACGDGVAFHEYFFDDEAVYGETKVTQGATDAHEGSCGGRSKPEVIYYYHNPYNARLTFNTAHPETTTPTTLYIRRACDDAQSELRCDDGSRAGSTNGRFTLEQAAVGDYWIFVDTSVGTGGPFKLTVEVERLDPGCDDGLDNDRDGAIDGDDPGCASREDEDEGDETGVEVACSNGRDDDEDGRIDYPADPGCETLGDDDEADPEAPPACLNGLDDDADGLIDFPWDPGCFAAADDDEIDRRPTPECSNRLDDDRDGLIDFPFDPGCAGMGDRGEGEAVTACSDGEDNDGDGRIDFPWDPGCFAAGHASEVDPAILPACGDGEDNDEDGRVDFPFDPGCTYAADPDEADAPGRPICANERDDDRDGRTDFPDDPGCAYAADTNETNPGPVLPRCADGVDNDWDGLIDLDDLGCGSGEDDDEADPPQTPACVNGIDDDGDGLTDYPADPGCLAPGDLTEESLCREGVTVETLRSDRVEGQTAEGDADQYEASCGGGGQPERVYRYVAAESGTLRVWLDAEGTDHPAILSVRADCESGATTLGCTHVAGEEISAEIEPGEYFIFVDGGAPLALTSLNEAITLPEEPVLIPEGNEPPIQPVEIRHDFEGCNGWNNDGGDAFDCYGDISVIYDGHVSGALDLPEDGEISGAAGDYRFSAHSDFPHPQVWRIQLRPEQPNDPRPVTARLLGNLGSGAVTRVIRGEHVTPLAAFPYVQTHDGPTRDVPALHFMVPSQISELGQIRYNIRDGFDEVEILAQGVHLPLTIYTVVSALTPAQLLPALMADLVEQPSVEGPYHGAFRLHVTQD